MPTEPLTGEQQRLLQQLKGWRMEQARRDRLPAYMVCHDRTLELIARSRPASIDALLAVHGLGEAKVKRFGATLLAALGAPPPAPAPDAPGAAPRPEADAAPTSQQTAEDADASLGPLFTPR
jgi:ribonuclease D